MTSSASKRYVKDNRGRVWSHKSVVALVESTKSHDNPELIIQKIARDLIARARADGWSGPPFDPKILASLRGIKVHAATARIGADARILPDESGNLIIEYDPSKPATRTNFSICHELAHTFFPDHYEAVRFRGKGFANNPSYFELECLCDLGAAELLMPEYSFSTDLIKHGTSLQAVRNLGRRYVASSEAVLIRMSQLSLKACAVVFLSEKLKPTEKKSAQTMEFQEFHLPPVPLKLRVDYVRASEAFNVFIPIDKSVPDDSVAYQCLATNDIVEGSERWDVQNFGLWRVQAVPLPIFDAGRERRVAAFISAE